MPKGEPHYKIRTNRAGSLTLFALSILDNPLVCGRYRLSRRKQLVEEYFDTAAWDDDWIPRYNIAPIQHVPVIRRHPKEPVRHVSLMRWGLIPHWAKDRSVAMSTINAKSETAATKPAFRDPLRGRAQRKCTFLAMGLVTMGR